MTSAGPLSRTLRACHASAVNRLPVEASGEGELQFRLRRCSCSYPGPTDDFGEAEEKIVAPLNREAAFVFQDHTPLNYVLAQVYVNTPAMGAQKQTKERAKAHADKTKDMLPNGAMAFAASTRTSTASSPSLAAIPFKPLADGDPFDLDLKGNSGETKFHFRLKEPRYDTPHHGAGAAAAGLLRSCSPTPLLQPPKEASASAGESATMAFFFPL